MNNSKEIAFLAISKFDIPKEQLKYWAQLYGSDMILFGLALQ